MLLAYRIAADCVVILHMTYVLVVVLGLPAIWIGILLRHQWARNFWWRFGHLSMILVVVGETWAGITCPLTTWENQLRELGQSETYQGDFIANHVHDWLFYDLSPSAFSVLYTAFGLLVVISFIAAPPHLPRGVSLWRTRQ